SSSEKDKQEAYKTISKAMSEFEKTNKASSNEDKMNFVEEELARQGQLSYEIDPSRLEIKNTQAITKKTEKGNISNVTSQRRQPRTLTQKEKVLSSIRNAPPNPYDLYAELMKDELLSIKAIKERKEVTKVMNSVMKEEQKSMSKQTSYQTSKKLIEELSKKGYLKK
ncbi:MAG TPA: hypothetical protein V6C96_04850, partial [Vampirovibrionales bacterium]